MNILRTILSVCVWMAACMASVAMAAGADAASAVPAAKIAMPVNAASAPNKNSNSIEVGQAFSVKLKAGTDCGKVKPDDQTSLEQISLLVNGMDSGLHPLDCDPATDELTFVLNKADVTDTPAARAAWHSLLGHPMNTMGSDFKREVRYTVRQPSDKSETQNLSSGKLQLRIAKPATALIGSVLVLTLWIALVTLGRNSGMLRDAGTGSNLAARTYSLGRVQMAWWFGIIMGAYIFLWVLTDDIPPMNSQALLLMGVSGVTGLVSASLDASRQTQAQFVKGKFLEDLLTDVDGVTLHRFQMLAMTVILGVMFIVHVATTLSMPEFDGSLLALMGIAGGTYIGFKVPEKHTDQADAAAPAEEHKAGYTPEAESSAVK